MSDRLQRSTENSVQDNFVMVPMGYAEKSMASLMQLHAELMEEKERRVDLYRRLMDKEQALAELKMYVRLLEEKVSQPKPPPPPPRPIARERFRISVKRNAGASNGAAGPPRPPQTRAESADAPAERSSTDGWRTW
jgi:hypothetical protein